ncbi:peptidoglycan DD-metalloendopeptidase family protein [Streptomyces sp. R39]|uniref:Peptidoglycan DD-metalloendopeptidase family protein n=1 Tax=Streptomyces sp. R39 TaxID=3238631 RepID=A0AB39QUX0_9ACTN
MRTDDLRLLTAVLMLLLTGVFLATPAKAAQRQAHCAFGPRSIPPPATREHGTDRTDDTYGSTGSRRADRADHTGNTARTAHWTAPTVHYRLSARYAAKGHRWKRRHTGQDFAVDAGTPVYAVGPGRVVTATCGDGFGNQVVLHHPDGYYTQYAHLSAIDVRPGQRVSAGQRVGTAGATGNADGPHLHFEVRTTPRPGSAVPPLPWLRHHGVDVPAKPSPEHPRPTPSVPTPSLPATPTPGTPATPDTSTPTPSTPATSAPAPVTSAPPSPGRTRKPTASSPTPVGPAAPARTASPSPGRPARPQQKPTPQEAPAHRWNPATPWDPMALWYPATR